MRIPLILCITLALATIVVADDIDKGVKLFKQNSYTEAANHFRTAYNDKALEEKKRQHALKYLVACLTLVRTDASLTELGNYAKSNPKDKFIQSRFAYAFYLQSKLSSSVDVARKILPKLDKKDKWNLKFTLQSLAFGSYAQGRYSEAVDYFDRLMESSGNLYYAHLMKLASYQSGENIKVMVDEEKPLDVDALLVHISHGMSFEEASKKKNVLDYNAKTDSAALLFAAGEYARYKKQYQKAFKLLTQAEQRISSGKEYLLPVIQAGLKKLPQTATTAVAANNKPSLLQARLPGEAGKEGFAERLIDAELAAKSDPENGKKWLEYAALLLSLPDVEEAQYTAEAAAEIAAACSSDLELPANMVQLQAMVNRLDFAAAANLIRKMVQEDGIVINQIDILNSYVAIHALGGELEEGKAQLQWVLTRDSSYYGAHVALIELLKVEAEQHPHLKEGISKEIAMHRSVLAEIMKKFSQRLEPQMRAYIKSLMGGAA